MGALHCCVAGRRLLPFVAPSLRRFVAFSLLLALTALTPCVRADGPVPSSQPTTTPTTSALTRPPDVDSALWATLLDIDARSARIHDLSADFTQEKFTPLLRKPLVSKGRILIKGPAMLWDTRQPEPTLMRIDPTEVRLLYPRQKVVEIYPIDQRMASLAASPMPRLDVLTRYFAIQPISDPQALWPDVPQNPSHLALRLRPTDPALREHIQEVCVLLDIPSGFVLRAQTIDADGDRTTLAFSNVRTDAGLSDRELELEIPAGVEVTRPLDALNGGGNRP